MIDNEHRLRLLKVIKKSHINKVYKAIKEELKEELYGCKRQQRYFIRRWGFSPGN